jgi:hypothetical protein
MIGANSYGSADVENPGRVRREPEEDEEKGANTKPSQLVQQQTTYMGT